MTEANVNNYRVANNNIRTRTKLSGYEADINNTIINLIRENTVKRIWQKDHSIWNTENQNEIIDRLGWLTVIEKMSREVPVINSFAEEIKAAGFRHIVLIGMGGSSLCAEVLGQIYGNKVGLPKLIVLDSTVPEAIKSVVDIIDPLQTLFIVSSKSGTTTEPNLLYKYFKQVVMRAGKVEPGENFISITDPGTILAHLAQKDNFRRVFLNPPDIGGRYSVLSYFGLIPGALIGTDIKTLINRAVTMSQSCTISLEGQKNPGLWLGAVIGSLALKGHDKMTLVISPSLNSFGLWVEQLVAESTGKEGKGIIPIIDEPLLSPEYYGTDRFFIYLRFGNDDNKYIDYRINALIDSGQPVVVFEIKDKFDIGAEFYRWEFATAVAGKIIGIHPFNQPDVKRTKDATEMILREYVKSKKLPMVEKVGSFNNLLSQISNNKYLAIMAYIHQTSQTDELFSTMRKKIIERYHVATTLGYGPRFLHSTGQLHKGGPNTGLFLQLTSDHDIKLPIPDEPYTFATVVDSQALGDLQALRLSGRPVVSVRLKHDDTDSLKKLVAGIK